MCLFFIYQKTENSDFLFFIDIKMKKQLFSAGIFILTLCSGGLLVWGAGQYLKSDWTPDFQKLKSTNNGNQLTAKMRDDLMDGLSKIKETIPPTVDIPKFTISKTIHLYSTQDEIWRWITPKKIDGDKKILIEWQKYSPYSYCAIWIFEVWDDKVQWGICRIEQASNWNWYITLHSTHWSDVVCQPTCFRYE